MIMKAKNIKGSQPSSIDDLKDIEVWRAFSFCGEKLRCVPTEVNGSEMACRSCHFIKIRSTSRICPGMNVCCAHKRKDKVSVKFISADINCINDERMREMAKLSDLNNRW